MKMLSTRSEIHRLLKEGYFALTVEISVPHGDRYEGDCLWDVVPCSLVESDSRFGGDYCFHHQGDRPDDGDYVCTCTTVESRKT
jgi:hypothetical protein